MTKRVKIVAYELSEDKTPKGNEKVKAVLAKDAEGNYYSWDKQYTLAELKEKEIEISEEEAKEFKARTFQKIIYA